MNAPLFDTHLMVKRLMAAGFSDTQAETVTDVVREARQFDLENLATKADLKAEISDLRVELKAEISDLRVELRAEISELRAELRTETGSLRNETGSLRSEIGLLRSDMQVQVAQLKALIADSRTETLRWIFGLAIAQTGLIVALLRIIPSH